MPGLPDVTGSTCDLCDEHGDGARVFPPGFQHFGAKRAFAGRVVTVRCPEDNSALKELVGTDGAGRVIVVDGGGSMRCALLGDMVAEQARSRGWAAIVVYGCVRDRRALAQLDLGIMALGSMPRRSAKNGEGRVGVRIDIGGVPCFPGDMLVADDDGIVLLGAAGAGPAVSPGGTGGTGGTGATGGGA